MLKNLKVLNRKVTVPLSVLLILCLSSGLQTIIIDFIGINSVVNDNNQFLAHDTFSPVGLISLPIVLIFIFWLSGKFDAIIEKSALIDNYKHGN